LGLRRKISLYLVSILSILALLTLVVLRWQGEQKGNQLEDVEARGDFRRLMVTFQSSTFGLNGTLKSWANRTDLYDYFVDRAPQFRKDELSAEALAVADVDFLVLLDLSGGVVGMTEVPGANGEMPATDEMKKQSQTYAAHVKLSPDVSGCGAIKANTKIALVCFSPTFNSQGKGHARGYIMIGRWVNDELIRQVSRVTGLIFDLVDVPTQALGTTPRAQANNMFKPDAVVVVRDRESELTLRSPLVSIFGQDIAEIRMTWPRKFKHLVDVSRDVTEAAVLTLILISGGLLMLLLDLVVVRRLNLLREELASIVDSQRWSGDVSVKGEDELAALARYAHELVVIVRDQVQDLKNLSQTDALTGLPNRRAFDERLTHILAQHARQKLSAALILMDVDHFKKYNDNYGHPAGDAALQKVAQCLRTSLRRELDLPARVGGEEFAVLLEGVTAEQAYAAAESIRNNLQNLGVVHAANPPMGVMTLSLGVAVVTAGDNVRSIYHRADEALYQSKSSGRNQVSQM
jgi:diguanylate cyclase (GGDEF)-like protein